MSNKKDIWLKASVIGSIWASTEIVLGNFLHGLRIPFTGEILTSIAVVLLVSSARHWKENGIVWRAGVICALMKFMTPGIKILGPVIGILSEAFVIELALTILGKNYFGFIFGGALALSMPLLQKIINYIILYGFNIVKVFYELTGFISKATGLEGLTPSVLVMIFFAVNITAGIVSALVGIYLGKTASSKNDVPFSLNGKNSYAFGLSNYDVYSPLLLVLNFLAVVLCLIFVKIIPSYILLLFSALYTSFVIYRYKRTKRLVKNIKFWIQLVIFVILSAVVLTLSGNFGLLYGLNIAVEMLSRVFIITFGFAAISIELKNPVYFNYLKKSRFRMAYLGVEAATSSLPVIVEFLSSEKRLVRHPLKTYKKMISHIDVFLDVIKSEFDSSENIIIITGKQGEGKTTFLAQLVKQLQNENIPVSGFLSLVVYNNSVRIGYDLKDISSGESVMLCRIDGIDSDIRLGKFIFSPSALEKGNSIISSFDGNGVFIIDEVGPLELTEKGWHSSLDSLLNQKSFKSNKCIVILVIRESLVNEFIGKWNIKSPEIFNISDIKNSNSLLSLIRNFKIYN